MLHLDRFYECIKTIFVCSCACALSLTGAILCATTSIAQPVMFNEVFARADDSTPEWIELRNYGTQDLELQDWSIADKSSRRAIPAAILAADSYLLVSSDAAQLRARYQIPEGIVIIEMRLPSLNNGGDALGLRTATDKLVDSMAYGKSLVAAAQSIERIDTETEGLEPDSWGLSLDALGASPGRRNSITPLDYDLACIDIQSAPGALTVLSKNLGRRAVTDVNIRLTVMDAGLAIFSADTSLAALAAGEEAHLRFEHSLPETGWFAAEAQVVSLNDEGPANDRLQARVWLAQGIPAVVFSEVMFRPLPDAAEYLELVNIGEQRVDLSGWSVKHSTENGSSDSLHLRLPDYCGATLPLAPENYLAVCWDTAVFAQFPGLNECDNALFVESPFNLRADGGVLLLCDPNGQMIDSVNFGPAQHIVPSSSQQGRSLERKLGKDNLLRDPEWSTSADARGGTAGESNSVSDVRANGSINILPNPLLSGPIPQIARVEYHLPFTHAFVRIQVFDSNGRAVAQLLEADFSAARGMAEWDARDFRGAGVAPGAYIVRLEAAEYKGSAVYCETDLLLVGR